MFNTLKILCIKSAQSSFTKDTIYNAEWSNKVVTSAPQLLVTDDTGYIGHIVGEGLLIEDEWFNEHFIII